VVHHRAVGERRGAVLFIGPLGLERTHAYASAARWGRTLAAAGFDTMRFDFRGIGESTGEFGEMTFDAWARDVARAHEELTRACPGLPIGLHGLRGGALFAARAFAAGQGDALVLWDPPTSARAHMLEVLRRKLAADYAEQGAQLRKTREQYVADLERGAVIEVEGYPWSKALWGSAAGWDLVIPAPSESRPWRVIYLDGRPQERFGVAAEHAASTRIPKPPFWLESKMLRPNLSDLFGATERWLLEASAPR